MHNGDRRGSSRSSASATASGSETCGAFRTSATRTVEVNDGLSLTVCDENDASFYFSNLLHA